ncbi:hypothetical protein [Gloeocapsa sp. PCC 7428]|nr:hypothetical protein [Gloeocapsa sp. PCC 7428]
MRYASLFWYAEGFTHPTRSWEALRKGAIAFYTVKGVKSDRIDQVVGE